MFANVFRRHRIATFLFAAVVCGCCLNGNAQTPDASSPSLPERVSFNAHIRPLMSNTCFTCHGPDEEENESEFQIDSFAAATGSLPSDEDLVGIQPGKPMESEVYLRIIGKSDGESMPPSHFRHQLSDYDKALFRKWIEQGAEYEQHWSYAPVQRPEIPALNRFADHVGNSIDPFVLAPLESAGIEPSPPADKATLLRRLSLDLIGLPPTVEELRAFLADDSEDAYARQVERLLNSKHFGERMAISWLDIVRFADTVGFHGDQNLRNFAYRDYVINAFNTNKPFDEFTREQLAGDLLPNPTPEQLTATGMLRLNMVTREGGAQPGEYLAKYKADRVRTLGTAWLGATLGCCECHNHKYDPYTAKDFYALGAFFDDIRQWGVYSSYGYTPNEDLKGFNNDYPFPPEMRVESPSLRAEIRSLQRERDTLLRQQLGDDILASDSFQDWTAGLTRWLESNPDGWKVTTAEEVSTSKETTGQILADGSVLLNGTPQAGETITLTSQVTEPLLLNALRLEVLPDESHRGFIGRDEQGRFRVGLSASIARNAEQGPRKVANRPRFVRIELTGADKVLSLAEVEVFGKDDRNELVNWATRGTASQSTNYSSGEAAVAIDGNTDGEYHRSKSVTHTSLDGDNPWWEVDLDAARAVEKIVVWNRTDGNYSDRLKGFRLVLLDAERQPLQVLNPAVPKPSVSVAIPSEVTRDTSQPLGIAWAEADRRTPARYSNGREPLVLEEVWQSGPGRWQLPSDEATRPHTAVYHLDRPVELAPTDRLVIQLRSSDVGRVRLSVTPLAGAVAGWSAASDALRTAVFAPAPKRTEQDRTRLIGAFHRSTVAFQEQSPASREYRDRILARRAGLAMTLVTQSLPADQIPDSRVRPRGDWQDESGEAAPPGFPHFLPAKLSNGQQRLTRLDLADWLTAKENPLTSRHFVNRTWKQFFGTGLSAKLDDLGNQGEWPSHPQLLDWLAAEFIDSDWDVKHLVRLIVSSQTYQQTAATRQDLQATDPYNRRLAQQSARRLEAETIRDNALAISGLLQADYVGGPSVFPYQPAGYYGNLQFPNRTYRASEDFRQYRRGVYMHWQRTFLHPMLVNFDAPSRDECAADRSLSNSPQQALTLLNDTSFVEAAHAMAARLLASSYGNDFEDNLSVAFLSAVSRPPTGAEAEALRGLYERQLAYFEEHHSEAEQHLAVGSRDSGAGSSSGADAATLAAWSQVCRVILNLHETITRY